MPSCTLELSHLAIKAETCFTLQMKFVGERKDPQKAESGSLYRIFLRRSVHSAWVPISTSRRFTVSGSSPPNLGTHIFKITNNYRSVKNYDASFKYFLILFIYLFYKRLRTTFYAILMWDVYNRYNNSSGVCGMVCGHGRLLRLLSICFTPRETMQTRGEELGAPVLLVIPSVQHQLFV